MITSHWSPIFPSLRILRRSVYRQMNYQCFSSPAIAGTSMPLRYHVASPFPIRRSGTSQALEERGIEPSKSTLEYIANAPIDLSDEQMEDVETLIDKLEEDDDVQHVYTNIN